MPSKRDRKRWQKYIQQQATLTDLKLVALMLQEIQFERRMRNKALRLARKRRTDYIR